MTATRRWLAVALVAVACALAALTARHDVPRAGAVRLRQTDLREAYRLVDTWDGNLGQAAPGSAIYPAGIDVTDEMVVLVDRGNHRVQRFTPAGQLVAAWGQFGTAPGDLDDPRDVAVDMGRIYVTDLGNDRVVIYDLEGRVLETWAPPGLDAPWGIAARAGRVYVTSRAAHAVVVLEQGAVVARWEGFGDPRGLALGADGRVLYVADTSTSTVRFLGPDGAAIGNLRTSLAPVDVAVDPGGDLYVQSDGAIVWYPAGSASSRQALYFPGMQGVALSTRHGLYATIAREGARERPAFHGVVRYPWKPADGIPSAPGGAQPQWPLRGFPPGRLQRPHAIHVSPTGRIWVVDDWARLQTFTPDGQPQAQLVPETTVPFAPVDITEAPDGDLIVGEARRLLRMSPTGTISQALGLAAASGSPWLTALAWRGDGLRRVTVLDGALVHARDYGLTRTLRAVGAWPLAPAEGWSLYWDLAVPDPNPRDRVYAADRGGGRLVVFESGRRVATWTIEGVPTRIAVDAAGSVYVLAADGLVHKLTSNGELVALWDVGAFSAGASEVVDVAVDAAGRVYTVDRAANAVHVWARDPEATPEAPASRGSACRLRGDKRAEPEALQIGERVTVRLQVGGECPNTAPRADIVLAIDRSGSMNASGKITDTRAAAVVFLRAIDLTRDRVGIVTFNNTARLVQPLTADRNLAEAAVRGISAVGGTNIADALSLATSELFGPSARSDAQGVIVLLTDGRDPEPDAALDAAAQAQSRGARLFTIGFGDVDPMVMTLSASTPEHFYYAPDTTRLTDIYTEIAQRITADVLARSMTVVDRLPADMRYVAASASPPAAWDAAARTLTWQLTDVPFAGATLSYQVEPTALGRRPTNVEARADYVDGLQWTGYLRFPVPSVDVLNVQPSPTPTFTPFPTPTPLPTATPAPTDTPRPPEPLFLPIAVRQVCRNVEVHADVALVMDTSSSMLQPASEGAATKLAVAIAAARAFVEMLELPGDQAAVVTFNSEVALVQPLTGESSALLAALDGLQAGQGTRIDHGIDAGAAELTGPRGRPGTNKVMVLLTDGVSSGVDDDTVRQRAEAARAAMLLYTIGLGSDVDAALLREIASGPGAAFLAPSADELGDIYRAIAYTIVCPNLTWP